MSGLLSLEELEEMDWREVRFWKLVAQKSLAVRELNAITVARIAQASGEDFDDIVSLRQWRIEFMDMDEDKPLTNG